MHVFLIFATIFTGVTLFCSDKHTQKIPPRLGEISKEKSKSHDSLQWKKSVDASPLLPTRTSDTMVPVLTRTKSLNRTSAKQKLSKTASSGDLTARIQAVTYQRSTAKKSPPIVRFNDRPAFYIPAKTKQIVRKEQKLIAELTAEQIKQFENEIADELSNNRRDFFKEFPDTLAKIEAGIEKQRAKNKLLDS